ncbi:hypothetical protein Pme01_21520 [Planosporangium mesophilum]|uniref:Uncharacterized protein n=1 Tax=Planosporangium mesophilum TaxID=689768 RepID=A0A8J3T8N8_9ACTN|nr:hypothetical protein Pme01_21520 [Planosporangium mesophilum]
MVIGVTNHVCQSHNRSPVFTTATSSQSVTLPVRFTVGCRPDSERNPHDGDPAVDLQTIRGHDGCDVRPIPAGPNGQ